MAVVIVKYSYLGRYAITNYKVLRTWRGKKNGIFNGKQTV